MRSFLPDVSFSSARFKRYAFDLALAVHSLANEVRAQDQYGVRYYTESDMSITGFQPGAIKAAIEAAKKNSQDQLSAAMTKLAAAQTKASTVPEAINQVAKAMEKEADDALQELAQFTNGGPLLDDPKTPLPVVNIIPPRVETGAVERIKLSHGEEPPIPS